MALPVMVLHGGADGPVMWLSAAVHGDELCGVEIIRRVIGSLDPRTLRGTLLAVPVLNVYGFNTGDRFLPDRRDLNRSFPGSARGSLAGRIAHLMMSEVVGRCSVGIDLHTGSDHRTNLPQVRGDLENPLVLEMAERFAAPLSLNALTRDGSLRAAATNAGAAVLLFEGGEADRFDEDAIETATSGVLRVMAGEQMVDDPPAPRGPTRLSWSSGWVRASRTGIAHTEVEPGDVVGSGDTLAVVHDPFGKRLSTIRARQEGMVIGLTRRPLVNRGDAVAHIAQLAEV
jgi:predicted deacylase